jgi:PilZ domain-containing protein
MEVGSMVKRYGPRVGLTCKVILAGERSSCEGRVLDVSLPGCLIECDHSLRVGDYVRLRLFFPDQARPMNVPLAAVRWVDRARVGVEFIRSSKSDQARLATLVRQHVPSTGFSDKWKESITKRHAQSR